MLGGSEAHSLFTTVNRLAHGIPHVFSFSYLRIKLSPGQTVKCVRFPSVFHNQVVYYDQNWFAAV